ncbi:conserved hypothetical protein [Vibrio phage 277E43-1]|nr:conserved hypothetical protein [Vibrio phage 277E43-1]
MNAEQKELIKQLSKSSPNYFEITEGDHPQLLKELSTISQGEYIQLAINKRCYLLQQDIYDFVGTEKVTFTNLSSIKNLNITEL